MTLRCDDAACDPRVDPESCRALGIRSMVAVPIRREGTVVGLLEVFAPQSHAFAADQEAVLRRLAEIVSSAIQRAAKPAAQGMTSRPAVVDDEFPVETPADLPLPQLSHSRNLLLVGAGVTLVFLAVWFVGNWSSRRNTSPTVPSPAKQLVHAAGPAAAGTLDALQKLAEQGDSAAQFAIGAHYASGEDVPQNYAEAFRWFSLAADQGYVAAQSALGGFYWAGRGVPVDLTKAYFWSLLAEAGGDDGSKQRVALLASRLSRNQILDAQQEANDWLQQHQNTNPGTTTR